MQRLLALVLGAVLLHACSEAPTCASRAVISETACHTTQDCIDGGNLNLVCLNQVCRKTCQIDAECQPNQEDLVDEPAMCLELLNQLPPTICEAQVCEVACPDAPCQAGERCEAGRCVYAYESFEIPPDGDLADLGRLGWNNLPTELSNPQTTIVFEGLRGCNLGDDNCAGPASKGVRFVSLERQSLQVRVDVAPTCRGCACCLQCQFTTPQEWLLQEGTCPGDRPRPLACPATPPSHCQTVCDACNACPNADAARVGERLTSCEVLPAQKICPGCPACEADKATCTAAMCSSCASEPSGAECVNCVNTNCLDSPACQDCRVCDDATSCLVTDPGSAACIDNVTRCGALGNDACFPAAVNYGRAVLEPGEQALVSNQVDLSQAQGQVVLQFDHVSFNVGETFRPGVQGEAPEDWPVVPQEVRVELCATNCAEPGSWQLGALDVGGPAIVPAENRRSNGLLLGTQTALDWTAGQVRVVVPPALQTAQFRFRFVPNIGNDARLGIDNVMVRRLP